MCDWTLRISESGIAWENYTSFTFAVTTAVGVVFWSSDMWACSEGLLMQVHLEGDLSTC